MLPVPDAEQAELLNADLRERRVVIAGPGSGKTTTGIHLVIDAAHEFRDQEKMVLYVSFSRAAMSVAFKEFERSSIDSIDVLAMTLDSLAWQITEQNPGGSEQGPDFEQVVESATRKLRSEYEGEFDDVVHLIVDEAQDLSAPRRELLCSIIDRLPADAGISIFGDPLQSIYDFDNESERLGSTAWDLLLRELSERGIDKVYSLGNSHRALRRGPRLVAKASTELRNSSPAKREQILDELLSEFNTWDIDEFVRRSSSWKGSSAVLVRTNAEALWIFGELADRGVACNWREPGRLRPRISKWVGDLWRFSSGEPVTYAKFLEFAAARTDVSAAVFKLLLNECELDGALSWGAFTRLLPKASDPTSPWYVEDFGGFTVSTIHQSKGLEWDNVVVVRPDDLLVEVGERQPEEELLFVALSRARHRVICIDWLAPFAKRSKTSGLVYAPEIATGRLTNVGIVPSVIGAGILDGDYGYEVLSSSVSNFRVEFDLLSSTYAEWPIYRCRVADHAVGVTTEEFGRSLARLLRRPGNGWPALGSVRSDGVETEFSHHPELRYWLKPRPFGMAEVINT